MNLDIAVTVGHMSTFLLSRVYHTAGDSEHQPHSRNQKYFTVNILPPQSLDRIKVDCKFEGLPLYFHIGAKRCTRASCCTRVDWISTFSLAHPYCCNRGCIKDSSFKNTSDKTRKDKMCFSDKTYLNVPWLWHF